MKKKVFALLLIVVMMIGVLSGCGGGTSKEAAKVDWTGYDALIEQVKTEKDFAAREALMHQTEDMLMATNCIIPIYYYNDVYMMKDGLEGFFTTPFGYKFFMYASLGDADTLRLCLASEPDKLDPALNSSVDGACLAVNSFAGLYTYGSDKQLKPNLATGVEISEDNLTYVFTLREGLKWSDGTDLTGEDFIYSWNRAAAAETAADYGYLLDFIEGYGTEAGLNVKCEGNKLTVVLGKPCAYFLDLCAFPVYFPVQKATVEAAEGYKDADGKVVNPGAWALEAGFVSNGAYTLQSWTHGQSMVYVKNPNYWDAENVEIEKLEFMLSDDDTAILAAYNAGDLDFIDTVPNDEIAKLKTQSDFYIEDQLGTYYISFNIKSPLFAGFTAEEAAKFRGALARLINRDYIVETVGQTGQIPATSFIPPKMADGNGGEFKVNDDAYTYADTASAGYYSTDYETAKAEAYKIFDELGLKYDADGKLERAADFGFEYLTNTTSGHIAIAQCVQQDLAVCGIQMEIKEMEWKNVLNERKAGNYDVSRNGWIADYNDPINMLEMWLTDSGNNDVQFGK